MKRHVCTTASSFILAGGLLLVGAIADANAAAASVVTSLASPTSAVAAQVNVRHAQPFTVRGVVIGEGAPKTIVPTTGATTDAVLAQARIIGANADADLIEFRIDYLDFATDADKVAALAREVSRAAAGKPMILTFRTQGEGGAKPISDADYGRLYLALIRAHATDLIDVEMFRDGKVVAEVVAAAHAAGQRVVMSSHDFKATPSQQEIVERLRQQDRMGADVLKIAVMPQRPADVITLLAATEQVRAQYSLKPQLTMSMGGLGAISRLSGEVFGSDMTFGMIGVPSAPGQVEVKQLRDVLDVIHASVSGTR